MFLYVCKSAEIETSFVSDQEPLFASCEHGNECSDCIKGKEVLDLFGSLLVSQALCSIK
jgi:hypothetical protein